MPAVRAHRLGGPQVEGLNVEDGLLHREDHGPERAHDDDEEHGFLADAEPEQGELDPADRGQRLETEGKNPEDIIEKEREREAELVDEIARLSASRTRIGELASAT